MCPCAEEEAEEDSRGVAGNGGGEKHKDKEYDATRPFTVLWRNATPGFAV